MDGGDTVEVGGRTGELRLLGERLCLDFANTVDFRRGDHPHEFLTSYADLAAWGHHAGALSREERDELLTLAGRRPGPAAETFAAARVLRGAVYRVFAALAGGGAPTAADLSTLSAAHGRAAARRRLTPDPDGGAGFRWAWDGRGALDRVLWPVALSAAELLTAGRLDRVRECPGLDGCGWLFLDTSKNGSRRWCSMEGCGNRAKQRRFGARRSPSRPPG